MNRKMTEEDISEIFIENIEELRMIRTNIGFIHKNLKSAMVTSCLPNEGKSTLVACMAAIFAQQGKKVLIMDANFRRPIQAEKFGLSNEMGLSRLLQENNDDIYGVIQATNILDVYILPAGPIPSNPTELLEKDIFKQIMKQALASFDMVLIDAPPTEIPDAQILASIVEGVLIVVEDNRVKKAQLKTAVHILEQAEGKIIGFMLNKVKKEKRSISDYYDNY